VRGSPHSIPERHPNPPPTAARRQKPTGYVVARGGRGYPSSCSPPPLRSAAWPTGRWAPTCPPAPWSQRSAAPRPQRYCCGHNCPRPPTPTCSPTFPNPTSFRTFVAGPGWADIASTTDRAAQLAPGSHQHAGRAGCDAGEPL